jgi:hypothetical protein
MRNIPANKSAQILVAVLMGLICMAPCTAVNCAAIYRNVKFNQNCEGYLGQAAHANTIATAIPPLEKAVKYAEDNGLTDGYTSVIYTTPNEDVGFWYNNLKTSLDELKNSPETTDKLTQSNQLIKLRETLIHHGKEGDDISVPPGISRFPSNRFYAIVFTLSLPFFLFGFLLLKVASED